MAAEPNKHEKNGNPPPPDHMALGNGNVPLLAHKHPPLKFARQHHRNECPAPKHDAPGYSHYCAARDVCLSNCITRFKEELAAGTPVEHMYLENCRLTVHYHSQSKLSQQELADLQRATHFDKKELQQWYKGRHCRGTIGQSATHGAQAS